MKSTIWVLVIQMILNFYISMVKITGFDHLYHVPLLQPIAYKCVIMFNNWENIVS
jgi:hypothetical protein